MLVKTILVTGGAGFIGSHYVRCVLREERNVRVINADALKYAANLHNLSDVHGDPRYVFHRMDLSSREQVETLFRHIKIDEIIHFAAESHVDRSIEDAAPFIQSNVLGTFHLLEVAREHGVKKFIQVSTDEVYGSVTAGKSLENDPLNPSNPYAASKAAADLLALSYVKTHGYPLVLTRCTNNYGTHQFPEKFIPNTIIRALNEEPIPVYGDGSQQRDWLHVEDHCLAIEAVRKNGRTGEVYHIGAESPVSNLEVAATILRLMGKPSHLIRHVTDRPAHDTRYCLDTAKIRTELGWQPKIPFDVGLGKTVVWYEQHREWWGPLTKRTGSV